MSATTAPIAIQLYSVRDALQQDFGGTIHKIAAMGYAGVETAGVFGGTPSDATKLFSTLGLKVCSMHSALPLGDARNEVIETAQALGTSYIVLPWLPPEQFASVDLIKQSCERLNEASTVAQQYGLTIGYHNHWFEPAPLGDSFGLEIMRQHLDPAVIFELDTYWIKAGGKDPAAVVRDFGTRAPLLHMKDGPGGSAVPGQPMVALGEGALDIPAIVNASGGNAQWLIVELDQCATDMLEAVEKSYQYLVNKELGHGR